MARNPTALQTSQVFVGTLAVLAASIALANQDAVRLADTVVTASGFEQKITEAPASISVISQEDLQQNRFSNLAQALDNVEGIDIRQGTGKTGGLNISIRGLPSEYTLILIDGRRQNSAGNVTPNGFNETSTSFMPPMSAIERIEVIRGPMSTLYGSDAMGGVINIITKKVASEWSGSVTLGHTFQEDSDYGTTSEASIYASGPLVENLLGLAVRGNIHTREESDLMFDNGTIVNRRGVSPVEGRNNTLGARLSLTPTEEHDFYFDFERGRQVYNNDECQLGTVDGFENGSNTVGCTVPNATVANGYADELRFERDQFALGHTARLGFGTWDNTITHNKTETIGRTIPGTVGLPYDAPYQSIVGGADRKLESTDLIFDTKLSAPIGESHIAVVGAQYWDAEVVDGIAGETFEQKSWSVFLEDEWRLRDDLALTLGGRYEDHEAYGGHFSPRAYLVWNTNDYWTLKGGVSKGYRTPDINDLHDGINGVSGQGTVIGIGSPDLDPEITTNTEIGAYFDNLAGFSANVTVFHNDFKDKIDSGTAIPNCFSADPEIPAGQAGCVSYGPGFTQGEFTQMTNIGEAKTQGLELGARWEFAPRWTLSGNYTYTDSEQKSGANKGAPLTNTPQHLAFARLNWDTTDRLSLWFKGEYRGERARFTDRYSNLSAANRALMDQVGDLDSYEVFHLGGAFRASESLTLTATIYNLFDKDFTEGTYYTTNTGATAWASNYVQMGRSTEGTLEEGRRLWVSATYDF